MPTPERKLFEPKKKFRLTSDYKGHVMGTTFWVCQSQLPKELLRLTELDTGEECVMMSTSKRGAYPGIAVPKKLLKAHSPNERYS